MAASCRLFSLAAAAALLFVIVTPINMAPATLASPVVGGAIEVPVVCEEFTGSFANHYCTRFMNRTTAFFPNPRGHKTFEQADKEFRDFIPLLNTDNPCHEKLGTLLCFIYFPFCQPTYPELRIYPCKEVCDEVAGPDSACTATINAYGGSWNDKLQCEMTDLYKPVSTGQCADGIAPAYPGSSNVTMPVSDNNSTTEPTETTEAPTTTEAPSCSEDEACNACDYRGNVNGGTFKRNEYCFAAKVTVKSYDPQDCKHAYSVTVDEQYDLLTPFNTTHATKAPEMGESAIIFTDGQHCPDCPKFEDGKTYLIAGLYSKASDGTATWIVDGSAKKSSLVSEWEGKYRKVGDWIQRANADLSGRQSRVCEMDSALVSAEQWH